MLFIRIFYTKTQSTVKKIIPKVKIWPKDQVVFIIRKKTNLKNVFETEYSYKENSYKKHTLQCKI